jgi:membrane protease YdiL (CAAX protease family)
MGFISSLLILLLAAYTILVEPFLRTNFYRMLKKQLNVYAGARLLFYRTQLVWQWSWVVVLVVILIPITSPLQWIGLTPPSLVGWVILGALVLGIALSIFLLRRNPGALAAMQRSLQSTSLWLPTTPRERTWYALTALTAGICEELLYRGFLIRFISLTFPGIDFLIVCILSGIIYGFSRLYQGMRGVMQASMMGFSFAIIYFLSGNLISIISRGQLAGITGSVIPAIVFHALAELRPLFLLPSGPLPEQSR